MNTCDVAIIGAGPYGLSLAAHLGARGVNFRIFGNPMEFWLKHMPKGMYLKSEGFASSLYDPGSTFTLKTYCKERGLPYADLGTPVSLEIFSAYGLEFQKRFVPQLERQSVVSLKRTGGRFELGLNSGKTLQARRVVIAVGLTYFEYMPTELASLPGEFVSHSSKQTTVDHFRGREVAIVGAGASSLDLAALLHQAGASVQVLARVPRIRFHDPPDNIDPSWLDQLRTPITGIGPGWKLFLCANMPLVFRMMSEEFRLDKVRRILGPAPCWFTKEQVVGKVSFHLGIAIESSSVSAGRVRLQLSDAQGNKKTVEADHVISATGYKPDVRRLAFLPPDILSKIRLVDKSPALSSNFESSVSGLYFVGVTAANTFGPLLRFAFGAGFAAPRLSKHLASGASAIQETRRASDGASSRNVEAAELVAK